MLANLVSRYVSTQDSLLSWFFCWSHCINRFFWSMQSWSCGNFNIFPFLVTSFHNISPIRVIVFAKVVHVWI
jgi:hypothetical protein